MTVLSTAYGHPVQESPPVIPHETLNFKLQREGEWALGRRELRFYRSWSGVAKLEMIFVDPGAGDGVCEQTFKIPTAELLAQGEWLVVGADDNAPRKIRAAYLTFTESGTYTFNITMGDGTGGSPGDPALVNALVRVDRAPVSREVVLVERTFEGQWRLAGFGPTPDGEGAVEVRVLGGSVYAMATDDYGLAFTANLEVTAGQRVRPTQFGGWLYEITEAGQLPPAEPQWWAAEGDNPSRLLGTARAIAVRYFRPLAHGPIPVEVV
ncbi:hypothetical protein N878_03925 [Pseudomonas sp. EGD-AK9]|uniref:hypothetical protein n=1 Tax=Pseudomonas sp. EGD-AK9 TaxID=1386078 RepID=UPI000397BDDF|nr:hypothetical protein [Pseudomonas sp. EGD-AK9]ERI53381.1 hypothetical protein N878_03925 [Pseudomonas sp. EGD-AK9]